MVTRARPNAVAASNPMEQRRIHDLVALVPRPGRRALDVGARDGRVSRLLARHFDTVVALDLRAPDICHPGIVCLAGDATDLDHPDADFDLVVCSEVLEHIPPAKLPSACLELTRVAARHLLIGVPYKQDLRVGRLTCRACGKVNPPYGHVSSFDESKLRALFPGCRVRRVSYVGEYEGPTNGIATLLMDLAGNPYGPYDQQEPCIHCGARVGSPRPRGPFAKVATRLALLCRGATRRLVPRQACWIHVLLDKHGSVDLP